MEAKKNPDKDLHRQSTKFFLIGLCISVTLIITAFEWRTVKKELPSRSTDLPIEASIDVVATVHDVLPPDVPIPKKQIKKLIFEPISVTPDGKIDDSEEDDYELPEVDFYPGLDGIEPEDTVDIMLFPEVQPKPMGGYDSFYSQLSKTLRYPKQAQRNQTTGKVFVEFVVDKSGAVSDLKILRGIGSGCDEEALRVLAQTRWEPGRQRGRPVKVRMAMPINFKLE